MIWWKSVNKVLASRGQSELLYGDASIFYEEYTRYSNPIYKVKEKEVIQPVKA